MNHVRITPPYTTGVRFGEATTCDATAPTPETPTTRLVSLIGTLTSAALEDEGLVVLEADSPRAIWYAALNAARYSGDASGVAELIDAGARLGWL